MCTRVLLLLCDMSSDAMDTGAASSSDAVPSPASPMLALHVKHAPMKAPPAKHVPAKAVLMNPVFMKAVRVKPVLMKAVLVKPVPAKAPSQAGVVPGFLPMATPAGTPASAEESVSSSGECEDEVPAPFDVQPDNEPPEPEPEDGMTGKIDYSVRISSEFSMPYSRNMTVLHLKMDICKSMGHLHPRDLSVYYQPNDVSQSHRLSDACLLSAIPAWDVGDVVVINDGRREA